MAELDTDLLRRLCEAPGIPGREDRIREVVLEEMRPIVDSVEVDALGNVIGRKSGKGGPKVLLAAHMDEIGFFVRHIDDQGFLRLQPVGGFDPRVLVAQRVLVHGYAGTTVRGALQAATKPIHLLESSEIRPPTTDDLFVDLGMSVDDVKSSVEIGDAVTMDRSLERVGDCVMSKSLDDRVCIYIMLQAVKAATKSTAEIFAVATTQEEVGLRGAGPAAYGADPDVSIALDVTLAMDIPETKPHLHVTSMRSGVALKIMDSSVISHPALLKHFRDLAEDHNIAHQFEILPRGGTDAGATQRVRSGNMAITLSLPTRYIHTVNEMASVDDIDACISLLAAYLNDAGSREYRY